MRFGILAGVAGTALALMVVPAAAAWHGYFSKEAGFSFTASTVAIRNAGNRR